MFFVALGIAVGFSETFNQASSTPFHFLFTRQTSHVTAQRRRSTVDVSRDRTAQAQYSSNSNAVVANIVVSRFVKPNKGTQLVKHFFLYINLISLFDLYVAAACSVFLLCWL
jgi:hypothetical protein